MIGASAVLLWQGIAKTIGGLSGFATFNIWKMGFGQVRVDSLINLHSQGFITMALISNLPQLLLSTLYAALNNIWTSMLVGVEWNSYGLKRKSLRTTYPVGCQRKTYFLSLPLVSHIQSNSAHVMGLITSYNYFRDTAYLLL